MRAIQGANVELTNDELNEFKNWVANAKSITCTFGIVGNDFRVGLLDVKDIKNITTYYLRTDVEEEQVLVLNG